MSKSHTFPTLRNPFTAKNFELFYAHFEQRFALLLLSSKHSQNENENSQIELVFFYNVIAQINFNHIRIRKDFDQRFVFLKR